MRDEEMIPHWSEDRYWTEALDLYVEQRAAGRRRLCLDLDRLDEHLVHGDSAAYRLVNAMTSVREHEAWDGHRGAPRLVMALLVHLAQVAESRTTFAKPTEEKRR